MIFVIFVIFAITTFYIYLSLTYMAIGKKAGETKPSLAWIPYIGPIIIAFKTSEKHWWPWLILISFFIPAINIIGSMIFFIFVIIWHKYMFEKINKPNWWAILMLIPIINLIIIGIAAWSK